MRLTERRLVRSPDLSWKNLFGLFSVSHRFLIPFKRAGTALTLHTVANYASLSRRAGYAALKILGIIRRRAELDHS